VNDCMASSSFESWQYGLPHIHGAFGVPKLLLAEENDGRVARRDVEMLEVPR
jgi:hypothetical protein